MVKFDDGVKAVAALAQGLSLPPDVHVDSRDLSWASSLFEILRSRRDVRFVAGGREVTASATVKKASRSRGRYQVRVEFEKPLAFLVVTKRRPRRSSTAVGTMIEVKVDIGPLDDGHGSESSRSLRHRWRRIPSGAQPGWTWNEIVPDDLWTGSIDEAQELVHIGDGDEVVVEVQKVNGAWCSEAIPCRTANRVQAAQPRKPSETQRCVELPKVEVSRSLRDAGPGCGSPTGP